MLMVSFGGFWRHRWDVFSPKHNVALTFEREEYCEYDRGGALLDRSGAWRALLKMSPR